MIVQRFKAVGWVAMVAIAATFLYLISLQVAVERGKLEAVEAQINAAQREVRQLQTEMGTRASLRQLERWNGEVLALSAPKATQFVNSGTQLVAFDLDTKRDTPNAPPPIMASVAVPKPVDVTVPSLPDDIVAKTVIAAVVAQPVKSKPKAQRVAMITAVSARDIAKIAQVESRKRP
jgi:type II secretory pathway pseudopilin PulG